MIKCYADVHHQYINIPKNAGTSILAAMFKLRDRSTEDVHLHAGQPVEWRPNGPPTFAVIRLPFQRFVSTWHNKVYMPHRDDTALLRLGARKGMPLSQFLMWVLSNPGLQMYEAHIRSQSKYLPKDLSNVTLIRHEDLGVDWHQLGFEALYGPLDKLNSSPRLISPQEVLDRDLSIPQRRAIDTMYENDFKLWEGAT